MCRLHLNHGRRCISVLKASIERKAAAGRLEAAAGARGGDSTGGDAGARQDRAFASTSNVKTCKVHRVLTTRSLSIFPSLTIIISYMNDDKLHRCSTFDEGREAFLSGAQRQHTRLDQALQTMGGEHAVGTLSNKGDECRRTL